MASKKRTPNFTIYEKEILIEVVEKYKDILENKRSGAKIIQQKDEL